MQWQTRRRIAGRITGGRRRATYDAKLAASERVIPVASTFSDLDNVSRWWYIDIYRRVHAVYSVLHAEWCYRCAVSIVQEERESRKNAWNLLTREESIGANAWIVVVVVGAVTASTGR